MKEYSKLSLTFQKLSKRLLTFKFHFYVLDQINKLTDALYFINIDKFSLNNASILKYNEQ